MRLDERTRGGTEGFLGWIAIAGAAFAVLTGCAKDPGPSERGSGDPPAGPGMPGGAAGQSAGAAGTPSMPTARAGSGSQLAGAAAAGSPQPGAGGSSSGGTDTTDCSALPLPSNTDDIVSTFEDGTGSVAQVAGRGGGFYMFNDGTGMQMPPPGGLPDARPMSRCTSMYALCMSGSGFTTWGAGMGTDVGPVSTSDAGMMTKGTWDASAYKGISFWAKANMGSATVMRVSLKDANTAPEGGNCDPEVESGAEACNDDWGKNLNLTTAWAPYTILYSEMAQSNWGKQFTAFDDAKLYSIQYQVNKGLTFDVCIDDLAFVR